MIFWTCGTMFRCRQVVVCIATDIRACFCETRISGTTGRWGVNLIFTTGLTSTKPEHSRWSVKNNASETKYKATLMFNPLWHGVFPSFMTGRGRKLGNLVFVPRLSSRPFHPGRGCSWRLHVVFNRISSDVKYGDPLVLDFRLAGVDQQVWTWSGSM